MDFIGDGNWMQSLGLDGCFFNQTVLVSQNGMNISNLSKYSPTGGTPVCCHITGAFIFKRRFGGHSQTAVQKLTFDLPAT